MYCLAFALRVPFFYEVCAQSLGEEESVIRILVVDDNPSVRRYLRGLLEKHEGCGEFVTKRVTAEKQWRGSNKSVRT
jgi:hypothetical protein